MKRIVSAPRSRFGQWLLGSSALVGVLLAAGATAIGDVSPEAKRSGGARSSFSLFAGPTQKLDGNQWECGLNSFGEVCVDVFNSPTGGGGYWPGGTSNAYIFNTGMQVVGISADGDYDWANDTLGAFFFDATGNRRSGDSWTNIYDSLDPTDLCGPPEERTINLYTQADPETGSVPTAVIDYDPCWGQGDYDPGRSFPTLEDLYITSDDVYQENLLGRSSVSQQDSWVQYWDGNPAFIEQRQHPMGILITQRSLAWNYPLGNESILYFIYQVRNVTDTYEFQVPNELTFFGGDSEAIPGNPTPGPDGRDGGITYNEVYVGFSTDMDVTNDARANFSTAILPFDLGISYHGGFDAPEFVYPPSIFFPPFFTNAPGIVGVKYLRSPVNPDTGEEVGLTRFSITLNGGPPGSVDDPQNDKQLWRYHSGFLNPSLGDAPCSVAPEVDTGVASTSEQSVCFVYQEPFDTRFFQSSGPLTLAPGQEATVVVAYLVAATVATLPDGSPTGIVANAASNANPPGFPSFHPGFPSARGCDADGNNCTVVDAANPVKAIERGAGWISYNGPAPSGPRGPALDGPENKLPLYDPSGQPYFEVVPGSLLGKALVAQTIFDSKFLLGFAPTQPLMYLVPGNNQVTVIWEPSSTEQDGDPFFEVAGDPASPLYNPNYRRNDVEAYAIWRTSGQEDPQIVAFFDYADTEFVDYTCETILPTEDIHDINPDVPIGTIGYTAGEPCGLVPPSGPDAGDGIGKAQSINNDMFFNNGFAGGSPGGGVVRLQDSTALGTDLTQVGADEWSFPPLQDTGVPFAWIDRNVVNNFQYRYAVQAIDVNSYSSGPYSLASARSLTPTTPRQDEQNLQAATGVDAWVALGDGTRLDDIVLELPELDVEDGTFSGPFPATDAWDALYVAPLVERLTGEYNIVATIDSFKPDAVLREGCQNGVFAFQGTCGRIYVTVDNGQELEIPINISNWVNFGRPEFTEADIGPVDIPWDPGALAAFDIPAGATTFGFAPVIQEESINFSNWEGQQNRRDAPGANTIHGGVRWFSGTEETTPDPASYIRVGHLAEVDSVWVPIHHTAIDPTGVTGTACSVCIANSGSVQYWGYYLAGMGRAADFRVTWGDGGAISVYDVSNRVDVPFSGDVGSSWGFLNTDGDGDGVISWWDFMCIGSMKARFEEDVFGPICPGDPILLQPAAQTGTVALNTAGAPATGSTANGFVLYLNGMRHFFVGSPPPAGTVWTLRAYSGTVRTEQGDGAVDPTGYTYESAFSGATARRPGLIPGLKFHWTASTATEVVATYNIDDVHTVPDPYLATSQFDLAPTSKNLQFVNLPPVATIRIYTLTGVLVDELHHDDPSGGGRTFWDLRNWSDQFVASGVYFFHVTTPEGDERVGKFTIVNFAGQN